MYTIPITPKLYFRLLIIAAFTVCATVSGYAQNKPQQVALPNMLSREVEVTSAMLEQQKLLHEAEAAAREKSDAAYAAEKQMQAAEAEKARKAEQDKPSTEDWRLRFAAEQPKQANTLVGVAVSKEEVVSKELEALQEEVTPAMLSDRIASAQTALLQATDSEDKAKLQSKINHLKQIQVSRGYQNSNK